MLYSLVVLLATCASMVAAGGTIEFCTDNNLSGHCDTIEYSDGECIDFGSDLNDEISSLDPQGSGHSCNLYEDFGCQGDNFGFTKHHNTLDDFNDEASSFRCSS